MSNAKLWRFETKLKRYGWFHLVLTITLTMFVCYLLWKLNSFAGIAVSDSMFFVFLFVMASLLISSFSIAIKYILQSGVFTIEIFTPQLSCEIPNYTGYKSFSLDMASIAVVRISGSEIPLKYEFVCTNKKVHQIPNSFGCPIEEMLKIILEMNPNIEVEQTNEARLERQYSQ
jgi:hypothetical protein